LRAGRQPVHVRRLDAGIFLNTAGTVAENVAFSHQIILMAR
jgi:hypothetical protein